MKHRFLASGHDKATMGRRTLDQGSASGSSVSGGKHNKCVILPARVRILAEALEKINQNWTVQTKVANDLIIRVGDSSFQLHKLSMASRSGYLNRLAFQRRNNGEKYTTPSIHIDNFPGGAEIFELIVKFCYGWKVDLTAANIAPVYCAAHYLEMSDDLEPGNLISKTESFLSYLLFSSWKDIFQILKSCETIPSWAKDLQVLKRCTEAIAWKACIDPKILTLSDDDALCLNILANNGENYKNEGIMETWWLEDVSSLQIDHFIEVIESIKRKGMKSELVGSCIAQWTAKWLSQIPFGLDNLPKHLTHNLLRVTTESLIRMLPEEKDSVSCNFLLHILKLGMMIRINFDLLNKLEGRIALMLENCCVSDLLVENYGNNDTVYDVGVVTRVVQAYASFVLKNPAPGIAVVGRLVDGYLTLVAGDEKLAVKQFQSLAETLPKNAQYCHDSLYSAIDMYLKAHPRLTEEERGSVSKAMDYHKLSQEGRQHAMQNDRLPLNILARLILLEQVNMTRSMTDTGFNYCRTRAQAIIRISKGPKKEWIASQKEIQIMKKEIENIKVQLNELQICKIQLQRQVQRCII